MKIKPCPKPKDSESFRTNGTETKGPIRGQTRAYSIARVQKECDPETVAAVMGMEMKPGKRPKPAGDISDNVTNKTKTTSVTM